MKKFICLSICIMMLVGMVSMCFAERIAYGVYLADRNPKATSCKLYIYTQNTKKPTVYLKKVGAKKYCQKKAVKTYFRDPISEREGKVTFSNLAKNTSYTAYFYGADGKKLSKTFRTKKK